ncbi:MAG: Yip1 family protein [Bacillota bacterium]
MNYKMGYNLIDWLFGVIASPVKTLREISRERPVGWAFLVALGVSVLAIPANFYGSEGQRAIEDLGREVDLFIDASFMVIGGLVFVVVSLFIFTGLLHLLAKLFRGQGGYWNFFSAYCFAEFPMIITVPATLLGVYLGPAGSILSGLIGLGISVWVMVLQVIAVRESYGLSSGASIAAYIIHFVILIAIPVTIAVVLVTALLFSL